MDPEYALRAFCREAKRIEDDSPADTPEQLGAWCAAVQRPREDLRGLYASKGYPIAKALLDSLKEYPQRNIAFDSSGWALDIETNAWIRSDLKDATLYTNSSGWLWAEPIRQGRWPVANDPPTSGDYVARHPTRYTWRTDVEEWARYLVDNYDVWVNTYHDHPEGYARDHDSLDVWGPVGRGDYLDSTLGDEIFDLLFNYVGKPDIDWCIYKRWIWTRSGGWERFGNDDFTFHDDHIHVTYLRES
jgi:hypothetical protein